VAARTDEKGGIKRPEVMAAIERFQAHMLSDPTLGRHQGDAGRGAGGEPADPQRRPALDAAAG
jgi:hypothetical protein